jgi:hypothetical protein
MKPQCRGTATMTLWLWAWEWPRPHPGALEFGASFSGCEHPFDAAAFESLPCRSQDHILLSAASWHAIDE